MQRCRQVFKLWWASTSVERKICPLVGIGSTKLPNSEWAKAYPAHPLMASLLKCTHYLQSPRLGLHCRGRMNSAYSIFLLSNLPWSADQLEYYFKQGMSIKMPIKILMDLPYLSNLVSVQISYPKNFAEIIINSIQFLLYKQQLKTEVKSFKI